MSIIEKAVNALGKGENRKSADDASPTEGVMPPEGSTVEKAAEEIESEFGSVSQGAVDESAADHAISADRIEPENGRIEAENIVQTSGDTLADESMEYESRSVSELIAEEKYVHLDFDELRHIGVLTPNVPRSATAEEFRTIKRPLLTNIGGDAVTQPIKHGNLIMVTSALEGDGKTFTSLSLAISIAMEQDKTVLFVDADTAKAQAGRVLGIPPDCPGLIDVLEDDNVELSDVLLHTNIENFRVLPAGDLHTHANELLASEKMRQLMIELSENYSDRVIVFDSPPLLLTTEAEVLVNFMGQIVFVVSADMTPHHAVLQAIEHIGEDKMVGMVLNRARQNSNPYSYTYGDVYGYGRNRQTTSELG